MNYISAPDEFKLLEGIQACGVTPGFWPQALALVDRSFDCKTYLLEFSGDDTHTGKFCDLTEGEELISYLSAYQAEAGRTVLGFLLHEASVHYSYCKTWLSNLHEGPPEIYSQQSRKVADWPGLITPLKQTDDQKILLACLFTSVTPNEIDQEAVLPTFQRLSRAISASLEIGEQLNQATKQQDALHMMLQNHPGSSILVDTDLSIKASTPSCAKLFSDGDVFTTCGDRLVPLRKELETALLSVTTHMTQNLTPSGTSILSAAAPNALHSLVLSRADERLCHVMVKGLLPEDRRIRLSSDGYVLVEVRETHQLADEVRPFLQNCFGLSNKEAELAHQLANSGSLNDTLFRLNITRNTAKSHLRKIYEKTETQSQLELSKLIHGLSGLF